MILTEMVSKFLARYFLPYHTIEIYRFKNLFFNTVNDFLTSLAI